ncbi:MAG: hypothetical protein ACI8YQ_004418 [Polaribacter sp.]|jgi:hypothetical protein
MRAWDLEIYSGLLKRPELYMGTNDWNEVENFIRAYELGSKWECDFMNLLTNQINDKYGVSMPASGLIAQLKIVSKSLNQNWEELFIEETEAILTNESDKENRNRFQKMLRTKILKYFQMVPETIGGSYFMNLNQINRQIDDWNGENLSKKEIKIFKEIREELYEEIGIHLTENFRPTNRLKENILKLKNLIKKENEV